MKRVTIFFAVFCCLSFFSGCASVFSAKKVDPAVADSVAVRKLFIRSEIASVFPNDGAYGVAANLKEIRVTFGKIYKTRANVLTLVRPFCRLYSSSGKEVGCEIKGESGGLVIIPQSKLDPLTQYFVIVANVRMEDNTEFLGSFTWSFTTGAIEG